LDHLNVAVPAPASQSDLKCRRTRLRATIEQASTVRTDYSGPVDISVENFSKDGFRFSANSNISAGTLIRVGLAGAGQANARIAWQEGQHHGCIFLPALNHVQIEAAFSHSGKDSSVESLTLATKPGRLVANIHDSISKFAPQSRLVIVILMSIISWALLALALRYVKFTFLL
jgi:hypothetical protein